MKKNNEIDSEISLNLLLAIIIKNKILFFVFIIFFGLIAFYYSSTLTKIYIASIKIDKPYTSTMRNFSEIFDKEISFESSRSSSLEFFEKFKSQLVDPTNFASFLNSLKSVNKFRESIEKNGSSLEGYLSNNFKEKKILQRDKEDFAINIEFKYPENINGHDILNNYVINFTKKFVEDYLSISKKIIQNRLKQVNFDKKKYLEYNKEKLSNSIYFLNKDLTLFKSKINRELKINIFNHKQALNTAKSIDLKDDILTNSNNGNSNINSILNEPDSLFYKGEKVINSKIENLQDQLNNLEINSEYNSLISQIENKKMKLDALEKTEEYVNLSLLEDQLENLLVRMEDEIFFWNPITTKALKPNKAISPNKLNYLLLGMFFGLLFTFLVIFIGKNKNFFTR